MSCRLSISDVAHYKMARDKAQHGTFSEPTRSGRGERGGEEREGERRGRGRGERGGEEREGERRGRGRGRRERMGDREGVGERMRRTCVSR